jgi:hypothetical protein
MRDRNLDETIVKSGDLFLLPEAMDVELRSPRGGG